MEDTEALELRLSNQPNNRKQWTHLGTCNLLNLICNLNNLHLEPSALTTTTNTLQNSMILLHFNAPAQPKKALNSY